jgi:hypothetical protein
MLWAPVRRHRANKKETAGSSAAPPPSPSPTQIPSVTTDHALDAAEHSSSPVDTHPSPEEQVGTDVRRAIRVREQMGMAMQRTWRQSFWWMGGLDDEDPQGGNQEQVAPSIDALYDLLFVDKEVSDDNPESDDETDEESDELRTDVAGITLWDNVLERCRREVATLGLFLSSHPLSHVSHSLIDDSQSLGEADMDLLLKYTLKIEDCLTDRTFARMERVF